MDVAIQGSWLRFSRYLREIRLQVTQYTLDRHLPLTGISMFERGGCVDNGEYPNQVKRLNRVQW